MDQNSKKPIKILTWDFPPTYGGIQKWNHEIAKGLAKTYSVTVVAPQNNKPEENSFDSKQGFAVTRLWTLKLGHYCQVGTYLLGVILRELCCSFKKEKTTLHCAHVVTGIAGYVLFKISRRPYTIWTYGLEVASYPRLFTKLILAHAKKILTISEKTKQMLLDLGVTEDQIIIIYPGVDLPVPNSLLTDTIQFLEEKYQLKNKKVLLSIGSLTQLQRYKGMDTTLKILPSIIQKYPDLTLVIVGSKEDSHYLEDLVKKLDLDSHVVLTGKISSKELAALYTRCDLFIMPAREEYKSNKWSGEGFGIVFLEANSYGKPVIGGRSGGVVEAIIDGTTGFLVNPLNLDEIASRTLELLGNPILAKQLGEQGRKRVLENFTWDHTVEKIVNTFVV